MPSPFYYEILLIKFSLFILQRLDNQKYKQKENYG